MWWIIAVAYQEVTHRLSSDRGPGEDPLEIRLVQVLLLMGSSMLGSVLQLPGVGGGSQLATIAALEHIFDVPKELAASCGIMLWLVTFVAVIPLGLLLAHHERLSLRKLSRESHQEERPVRGRMPRASRGRSPPADCSPSSLGPKSDAQHCARLRTRASGSGVSRSPYACYNASEASSRLT